MQAPVTLKKAAVEQKYPAAKGGQPAGNRGNAIAVDVKGRGTAVVSNGGMKDRPNAASNGIKRDVNPKRVGGKGGDGEADVEIVGVKTGGSAHGGGRVGGGVGDVGRNKKRRRRVQESDDDSEDDRGGGRNEVVEAEKPPKKKKEVRRGDALMSVGTQCTIQKFRGFGDSVETWPIHEMQLFLRAKGKTVKW